MAFDVEKYQQYFAKAPRDLEMDSLDLEKLPRHIAVIMDGNGRWAQQRGLKRSAGHKAGVEGLRELIKATVRLGIPHLTVYAFSTENWARSKEEVDTLMHLFAKTLVAELPLLNEEGVRLQFLGDLAGLPKKTQDTFIEGLESTKDNTELTLGLAVNYGGRSEILRAVSLIAEDISKGNGNQEDIDESFFSQYLYSWPMPDPDLLIRTSGELRLSNFLLWQLAYAEFYVTEVLWPDFTRFDLVEAILNYQGRNRRFGGV